MPYNVSKEQSSVKFVNGSKYNIYVSVLDCYVCLQYNSTTHNVNINIK